MKAFIEEYNTELEFPEGTTREQANAYINRKFPDTPENVVSKLRDPATSHSTITPEEFAIYRQFDDTFSLSNIPKLAAGILPGLAEVAGRLSGGISAGASEVAKGNLDVAGASTAEGAARGTSELLQMVGQAAYHGANALLPKDLETSEKAFSAFKALKALQNMNAAAESGDKNLTSALFSDELINQDLAKGMGEIFDLSVLIPVVGPGARLMGKATNRAGRGLDKLGGKLEKAGDLYNDRLSALSDKFSGIKDATDEALPGTNAYSRAERAAKAGALPLVGGLVGGPGVAAGIAAVEGAGTGMQLGGGLLRGVGQAMADSPTRRGAFTRIRDERPDSIAGRSAGRLTWLDSPVDYIGKAAAAAAGGAAVGGALGFAAGGWEGAGQGIGSGLGLGAAGGLSNRAWRGLRGTERDAAINKEWGQWLGNQQNKDFASWAARATRNNTKRKAHLMDTYEVLLKGPLGDDVEIRVVSDKDALGQAMSVDVDPGTGRPRVTINESKLDADRLAHETIHALGKLDGYKDFVDDMKRELEGMDEKFIQGAIDRYHKAFKKGKPEAEIPDSLNDRDVMLEEIAADYFAAFLEGKRHNYIIKGDHPFHRFASLSALKKLFKMENAVTRELGVMGQFPVNREMDKLVGDLVQARRRATKASDMAADGVRDFTVKDLADDATYNMLEGMGMAKTHKGRRIMTSNAAGKKAGNEMGKKLVAVLDTVQSDFGLQKTEDGGYEGAFFSPEQLDAIEAAGIYTSNHMEALRALAEHHKEGRVVNASYAAATKKNRKGSSVYSHRIPQSNRDIIPYSVKITGDLGAKTNAGHTIVKLLDYSLLRSKAGDVWAGTWGKKPSKRTKDKDKKANKYQEHWKTQADLWEDIKTYLQALKEGGKGTADVLGSAAKRDLINKLVGFRKTQNNELVPPDARYDEKGNIWKDFRLERIIDVTPRDERASFSEPAHQRGKVNFSPATDKAYLDAVNQGDTETAQSMVDEAAKMAGYAVAAHHGSPDLNPIKSDNRFKTRNEQFYGKRDESEAYFFTSHRGVASTYTDEHRAFDYQSADGGVMKVFLDLGNSMQVDGKGKNWKLATQTSVKKAKKEGYDSYTVTNTSDTYRPGGPKSTVYAVFDPSQIKSADPVTYDDSGKPVPLSERFKMDSDDIRYSPAPPVNSEPFKKWFGDSKVVDSDGNPKVVYHGSQRPDRVGSRFQKSKATSGPMAFFSDDPAIASSYASGKTDTSIEDFTPQNYFSRGKAKGLRNIYYSLSPEERASLAELGPRVGENADTGKIELQGEGEGLYGSGYGYHLKESGGNHLEALADIWLNSGTLIRNEGDFAKVLKAAGVDGVKYDDPYGSYPAVMPVFLSIGNPLKTQGITRESLDGLKKAASRVRKGKQDHGRDMWDKNHRYDADEWIETLESDIESGKNSFVWTSIPDWVTKELKRQGYDGIVDYGGKMNNGDVHQVYIPFEPSQIKSATANRGDYSPSSPDIRFSPAPQDPTALPVSETTDEAGKKSVASIPYSLLDSPFINESIDSPTPKGAVSIPDYDDLHYEVTIPARKKINAAIESGAVDRAGTRLAEEAAKMVENPDVAAGKGWYSRMRKKIDDLYGKHARLFTQILGATSAKTPVETNFAYSAELMHRYLKGDFDSKIRRYREFGQLMRSGNLREVMIKRGIINKRKAAGMTDAKVAEAWIEKYDLILKRKNGKQYGQNSIPALKALSDMWIQGKVTPKTPQFAMNLFGDSLAATIDVWAARTLRRILHGDTVSRWRIQPKSEAAVTNEDFALGQLVFRDAAKKLDMNPDDLQAIVWFGEKHIWDESGWTGNVGAFKSSFDEAFDVFYPEGKNPRPLSIANNIITFLQKERLLKSDLATGNFKSAKTHRREYEKAKRGRGVAGYIKERGLPDILKGFPEGAFGPVKRRGQAAGRGRGKANEKASEAGLAFSPAKPLNKRGGMLYRSPSGHSAVQLSGRAKVRLYGPTGRRIGMFFDSIEEAEGSLQTSPQL